MLGRIVPIRGQRLEESGAIPPCSGEERHGPGARSLRRAPPIPCRKSLPPPPHRGQISLREGFQSGIGQAETPASLRALTPTPREPPRARSRGRPRERGSHLRSVPWHDAFGTPASGGHPRPSGRHRGFQAGRVAHGCLPSRRHRYRTPANPNGATGHHSGGVVSATISRDRAALGASRHPQVCKSRSRKGSGYPLPFRSAIRPSGVSCDAKQIVELAQVSILNQDSRFTHHFRGRQ